MKLSDLKSQIYKLSVSDRLELLTAIAPSLQNDLTPRPKVVEDLSDKQTFKHAQNLKDIIKLFNYYI